MTDKEWEEFIALHFTTQEEMAWEVMNGLFAL